ncbi:MAG: YchF-related putative GTPase, partial [Nanoarchaeota archaeon]|nr:YchF-related putative GTPase [Nanoarchaeota archaeon]
MIIGLVGKPSAGKSTFFKAATLAEVEIANYPFTTIKPNSGVGYVKVECAEKFFNVKCNPRTGYCIEGKRFLPVQMIDVAGLVPDAHLGKGRGNQFLDDLRQADVLIHVIDVSGSLNAHGEPVETGSYDPEKDVKFLEVEIDMWYYGILNKHWEKFARTIQQTKQDAVKAMAELMSAFKVTEDMVKEVFEKLKLDKEKIILWTEKDVMAIAVEFRKRTKPMVIAANKVDVSGAHDKLKALQEKFSNLTIIPCSGESELALKEAAKHGLIDYIPGEGNFKITDKGNASLNDNQKKALDFIQKNILDKFGSTGIQQVLDKSVFEVLGYIHIF